MDEKSKTIEIGNGLEVVVNENGIPVSFSDRRPYRYIVEGVDLGVAAILYPFIPGLNDRVLESIMQHIEEARPIDPNLLDGLQRRSKELDLLFAEVVEGMGSVSPASPPGRDVIEQLQRSMRQLFQKRAEPIHPNPIVVQREADADSLRREGGGKIKPPGPVERKSELSRKWRC